MAGLRDLLESALVEIDRQMDETPNFTPEQALVWVLAAERIREALTRLYGSKPKS